MANSTRGNHEPYSRRPFSASARSEKNTHASTPDWRRGQVELTGVFDTSADTARKIAVKHGTRVFSSIAEWLPRVMPSTLSRDRHTF